MPDEQAARSEHPDVSMDEVTAGDFVELDELPGDQAEPEELPGDAAEPGDPADPDGEHA